MKTDHHPYLPLEIIMEDIVSRVSIRDVLSCSCVSKLWYKTINKDPHFASAYLKKSQKDASFLFFLFNVVDDDPPTPKWPVFNHFFSLGDDDEEEPYPDLDDFKFRYPRNLHLNHKLSIDGKEKFELVGNCNGLICVSMSSSKTKGAILILNLSRNHTLFITRPVIDGYTIICYGLGFDSLTHEYKVVLIARRSTPNVDAVEGNNQLFKCLVFTLGKNSWRETTTSTAIPHLLEGVGKTTTTTSFYKSSIFCGGALFWRSRSSSSSDKQAAAAANMNNNSMLLLSFDLHNGKFQIIQIPTECDSSKFSRLEQDHQMVDPLLEYKGYPCVARLERKISRGGGSSGGTTTIMDKVHLHILKDKIRQLWVKETFDIAPVYSALHLSPAISCFFRYHEPPPTRIVSLSDQVLLYCFDGFSFQIYNLQTKCVKYASGNYAHFDIFTRKDCSPPPPNFDDDDDNNNNLYEKMDYHLSSRIKNFLSLQSFIPKGAPKVEFDDIESILDDPKCKFVGYLCVTGEESNDCYLF